MAKILVYDVESSPNIGYTWGKWEQNVIEFIRESYMLCYAYRWLGETKTRVVGLPDFKTYGTVRCNECDQDLTNTTQYYDTKEQKVYCEVCNWRVGKQQEVPAKRLA